MSPNPNTRTETVEMKANLNEIDLIDSLRGGLGRSPYLRSLVHLAARSHGTAPPAPRESRGCRGPGRVASRGGAALSMRRHF